MRNFYCSRCLKSHAFAHIEGTWRGWEANCSKTLLVATHRPESPATDSASPERTPFIAPVTAMRPQAERAQGKPHDRLCAMTSSVRERSSK